ncbi:unnamed protein product [Pseudo-nitzschia multistriata]|uniref:DUF1279 domain-containing protein n=1 Tax=Pseudo-nitzschia multistriata TaxID=183589 RepID=A0A448Z7Y9_9STRA|nr:unnamed protein product [Pseudo-nitzschia multistriata]
MSTATSSSLSGFFCPHATNDFQYLQKNNIGNSLFRNTRFSNDSITINRRFYTPMTKEEEEIEKARVSHLSPEEKEEELRKLNREIAKLETLRGINTGELYTWSGRYKALVKNYGFPLFVYYWTLWATMGGFVYLGIDFGGLDAMALLERIDSNTGWAVSEKVDPQLGKMGVALILNECLEPVRLPFVVVTLKPVMDIISPPKY